MLRWVEPGHHTQEGNNGEIYYSVLRMEFEERKEGYYLNDMIHKLFNVKVFTYCSPHWHNSCILHIVLYPPDNSDVRFMDILRSIHFLAAYMDEPYPYQEDYDRMVRYAAWEVIKGIQEVQYDGS